MRARCCLLVAFLLGLYTMVAVRAPQYLTSQSPTGPRLEGIELDVPSSHYLELPSLSTCWESIATAAMKFTKQLHFLSLLGLFNGPSPSVSLPASVQALGCDIIRTQGNVPGYPIALQEYSYCGGYLNISAWVQNVNYNKAIQLYYANGVGKVTPLTVVSLGWSAMADGTNNGWEHWTAQTPLYVDGVTKLINLTYQALDINQLFVQTLNLNVVPSGAPPPAPPPGPVPYAKPQGFSSDISDYLKVAATSQAGISKKRMFDNISPAGAVKGLVTAAQSRADPDYWYHWVRDAALTMDVVVLLYEAATGANKAFYEDRLFWYAQASVDEQNDNTAITGLGEPKFYLDSNKGFTGPWGRPQNDGPGARAITLIRFAQAYLANGGSNSIVLINIWPAISRDLDYVAQNWASPSFDLWEEVSSHHFYNRMLHRRALRDGAAFATKLGYGSAATRYTAVAGAVYSSTVDFWDSQHGLVVYAYGPVQRGKSSFKDISVVLGVLHGYNGEEAFGYASDAVLASAYQVATSFLPVYPIAKVQKDASGKPLGMPVGRYPEDVYDGTGTSRGNPWYLTTAAMAELFYNAATTFTAANKITVTPATAKFWAYFAPTASVKAGTTYPSNSDTFKTMVRALQGWGDMWLRTVKYWAPADGRFPEEFDRESGAGVGAKDLTWSYASFLTAGAARARASGDAGWLTKVANLQL
ncbi:Glucoamylase [Drechslerella dactyloides]|uniref:glucan 1,4-alpha-glucosidase n=1 Tax=Drechslerella dactyloides TaxID=74499 RepID=A0AAD6J227_DREDA|nr:Glucoamylase [Drechslerella dactyloides]